MPIINLPKLGPVRFPDNISNEEFQGQLQKLSSKYGFELPKTDYGLMGSFTKGVSRGATRMGETFGDILPALGASALGFDDYAKAQMAEAKATEEGLARTNPAQFESYKQVGGPGEAARYALETLGEVTPDIASMLVPGGIGGGIAKKGAAKLAEKELAGITPGLVESGASAEELARVAGRVGAETAARQQAKGQGVGVYLGSFAMNTPEVFQSIYQDSGQLAPGASLLFGSVSAALDSVLPTAVLRSLSPAGKAAITGKILEQSGMRPGLARNITTSALKSIGTEGLTESAQEAINIAAEGFVNENRDMWTDKDFNRMVESGVRGAIAGTPFGAIQGVAKNAQEKAVEQEGVAREEAARQAEIDAVEAERQRQADMVTQAQQAQEQAAAQAAQRSQANLPMDLPGMEPVAGFTQGEVGPAMPTEETAQAELTPVEQESLFGATGKPTPEALASVKTAAQQQKQAEAQAKVDQKQALAELAPKEFDIMQNVRMKESGLSPSAPLQQLIAQASTFGPKVKAKQEEAARTEPTTVTSDQTWKDLGVGPSAILRKEGALNNLDITKQDDLDRLHAGLDIYLSQSRLSPKLQESVTTFKESLPPPTVKEKAPVVAEKATTEAPLETLAPKEVIDENVAIVGNEPLSVDEVTETTSGRLTKEEVPAVAAEFISSNIQDSVKTDLDTEGVPARAQGRKDLEQLEATHIQKNINKKALMADVVEPIRAVNLLREALDLRSNEEKPKKEVASRIKELENVIAGFGGDLQNVYKQLQTATPEQTNSFFDGVNAQTKESLDALVNEARKKAYPKSKTNRVFIPQDIEKDDISSIVEKRKKEIGIKATKEVTLQDAIDKLKSEIDKFIGKAGRAYMVEETPPEVLKALTQVIEILVKEGVRSLKDVTARVRKEFGENVFRTIKTKDIARVYSEQVKAQGKGKKEAAVKQKAQEASSEIGIADTVLDNLPEPKPAIVEGALNAVSTMPDTLRKAALGFMSLPNLVEVYGKSFPTLKNLLTAVEARGSRSIEYREQVSKIVNKGSKLIKAMTPEKIKQFNTLILDISRLKLDPRNAKDADHALVKQFKNLPLPLQNYAIELADQYKAYGDKYLDLLINQIPQQNNREYLTLVEKMKAKFEAGRIPFYLPLLRSGDYWISFTDTNGERVVFARESQRELDAIAAAIAKAGGTNIQRYTQIAQITHRSAPPTGFMAGVISDLQAAKVNDEVINDIYRSYLDLFPAESLKQQFQTREGYKGYTSDVVQGFAAVGSRMAHQLANMEYAPEIGNAIKGVKTVYETNPSMANRDIYDNIASQEQFLSNPSAAPWASRLSYFSYLSYITGNVSSAVINLTQLPIVVYSLLGGKYGYSEAAGAMSRATKMYFAGGLDNNSEFMPDRTFGTNAKGEYADLYKAAVDRSAIRRGVGYEMTEMRKVSTEDYTGIRSKIEHGLGFMFQNSERFNREVTLIATFDLARKSGMSKEEAIEEAIRVNTSAHSHALTDAGPRFFQQGWGKVMFTFKRFAQAQIYLVGRLAQQAYAGESPEVRSIARKQLTGIFGMAYLFAGVQGMPLYGGATLVASALNSALGDDDEPFDADESVRTAIGDLGYKGPLNQLLNVDIASRTGFNGMLWRDDKKRLADVGPLVYAIEHMMGPAYSALVTNPSRALDELHKGHNERAIEAVMPSFIRNGMKGVRFATEGALNSKGVPIVEDVNAYNTAMQILGFTDADISEAYARAGAMKEAEKFIIDRRGALLDNLYLARVNGDLEGEVEMNEKIADFNSIHPEPGIAISASTKEKSFTARQNAIKDTVDGVRINPKMKQYLIDNYGS